MISIVFVGALPTLALFTQAGVWILHPTYPQHDLLIEAAGARLNVVDLGQRDASAPSDCDAPGPLGDMLARKYR